MGGKDDILSVLNKFIYYKYFHIVIIWYICTRIHSNNRVMTKVIHVHLIFEKKNFYFGSISAVYSKLTADQIGMKMSTLLHSGLSDGSSVVTHRSIITQSHLIRNTKDI